MTRAARRSRVPVGLLLTILLVALTACRGKPPPDTTPSASSSDFPSATPTHRPTHFTQPDPQDDASKHAGNIDVTVKAEDAGSSLRDTSVGLSLEASELADKRLDPENSNLDDVLNKLGDPALRFGGNSLDRRFFWTSSGESKPDWANVSVGPDDLRRLNRLLEATGATVTLGVNLGHFDPDRAGDMAAHAEDILGGRLVGISIGNEPNGYATGDDDLDVRPKSWNTKKYVKQVQAYSAAIHARAPDAPIVGPEAYDAKWWRTFAEAKIPHTKALTQHWYPLYACKMGGKDEYKPHALNLVKPALHAKAGKMFSWAKRVADKSHLPLWLDETGATSCPGSNGAAASHAEAIWTVDYTLNAASRGVSRLSMHSSLAACDGGPPISMICAEGSYSDPTGTFHGRSGFAGLATVAAIPTGKFRKVTVSGNKRVFAYAIKSEDELSVVIINELDPTEYRPVPFTVKLPFKPKMARAYQLSGPAFQAYGKTVVNRWPPLAGPIKAKPFRGNKVHGTALNVKLNAGTATVVEFEK